MLKLVSIFIFHMQSLTNLSLLLMFQEQAYLNEAGGKPSANLKLRIRPTETDRSILLIPAIFQ